MSNLTVKRARTTIEFCTDLALKADHENAERALEAAKAAQQTMNSVAVKDAAQAVRDIEAAMEKDTVVFTLEALPRKTWAELEEAHKPREDNAKDETYGVNISTFVDVAVAQSVVSVTRKDNGEAIKFKAETEWAALADEMTNAQWERFAIELFRLNRAVTDAPFSLSASRETRD